MVPPACRGGIGGQGREGRGGRGRREDGEVGHVAMGAIQDDGVQGEDLHTSKESLCHNSLERERVGEVTNSNLGTVHGQEHCISNIFYYYTERFHCQ